MKRLLFIGFAALLITGCRGMQKESVVHPNLNMDFSERFEEQEANPFFADGRAMRPPVPGTVQRGNLRADDAFYTGINAAGDSVRTNPLPLTREVMARGQNQYNIYCTPCHSQVGDGNGIVMKYGYPQATSLHLSYLRSSADGHLYWVIANGIRNMPGYAHQINPEDRWAIVHYVRALQRSQFADVADVPDTELRRLQTENPNLNVGQ